MYHASEFDMDELVALARHDLQEGKLDGALAKLKAALALDSDSTDSPRLLLAQLYARLGLFARARDLFDGFLSQNPEALHERFLLGMVNRDMGEHGAALEQWDMLLQAAPTYPPALFHKGLLLAQQGQEEQARTLLETLIKTSPADNFYAEKAVGLLNAESAQAQRSTEESLATAYDGNTH